MRLASLHKVKFFFLLTGLMLLLAACQSGNSQTDSNVTPSPTLTTGTVATSTSALPTAPSEPLAIKVNETGITQAEYQAELGRFEAAAGHEPDEAEKQRVMNELINQELLAQGAIDNGFSMDEAALQKRYDTLALEMGGQELLDNWIAANGYTPETFRTALKRGALAAMMRDKIVTSVPTTAEQVHARQILFKDATQAAQTQAQLQSGADFAELARQADPLGGGDLGWFPRGYLLHPELETVFDLQPGEISTVIQTEVGFHILQVIERDPQRALDPQALMQLQEQALVNYLAERRSQSQIEIYP